MSVVAVTPARGALAERIIARLGADEAVSKILAIDLAEPPMPPAKLEVRVADPRDPVLGHALEGADVVVHLGALVGNGQPGAQVEGRRGRGGRDDRHRQVVHGTRNLLASAAGAGVGMLVHVTSAVVYGAHPDNPVPLTEDARLRASPDAPAAYRAVLAEELVSEFAAAHPEMAVTSLRLAPVLGPGAETGAAALIEAPRILLVREHEPVVQVVDLDDAAAAVQHVVAERLGGTYNVAADGWVPAQEAVALVGRRPLRVPEAPLGALLDVLDKAGVGDLAPGQLGYLMHPWVLATDRLKAAGWRAERSNREVLRAAGAAHRPYLRLGRLRARRRDVYGAAAAVATLAALVGWRALHAARRGGRG